jgi:hypothetical protein
MALALAFVYDAPLLTAGVGMPLVLAAAAAASASIFANATVITVNGPGSSYIDTPWNHDVSLDFTQHGVINSLSVHLDVLAPYADDVSFQLLHNGVMTQLYTAHGDTLRSYFNVTFQDGATAAPWNDSLTGTYSPVNALSAFNGQDVFGSWTLRSYDTIAAGDGTPLTGWSIAATTGNVPEPASLALMVAAMLGMGAARRRKSQ